MNEQDLLKRIAISQLKPDAAKDLTPTELAQLVLVVLNYIKKVNQAIEDGKVKGDPGKNAPPLIPDRDYLSLQTAAKNLDAILNEVVSKAQSDIQKAIDKIPTPTNGKDAKITQEHIRKAADMAFGMIDLPDFQTLITQEPEAIRNSLELLTGKERLSIDAIDGVDKLIADIEEKISNIPRTSGGGARALKLLNDVVINQPTNGQILAYSTALDKWTNQDAAATGGTWGTIIGTLSDQTDLQAALDGKSNTGHTHAISDVTGLQAALDAKATQSDIDTSIAALVNSSPSTLDTLKELADALGDDPNYATTTATLIGTKLAKASNLSDLANAGTARTNLGLAIGTDVQAYNAGLADIAGLGDPNADRIIFWDDSAGHFAYLQLGTNLSITGTTINAASGGSGGLSDGDYGDITVSSTSTVLTIDNDVVTYAKMQNVSATSRIMGRITSGAGDMEELTAANVKTILALSTSDVSEGSNLYYTDERAQDSVGGILTDTATIDFTYNDGANTITADVKDASITLAKMANMATASVIYRKTAGTGAPEVNTLAQLKSDLVLTATDVGLANVTNVAQLPLSYLDTDTTLAANSDAKVPSQKAIKAYVDGLSQGLTIKQSVRVATTAALATNTYLAGVITETGNGALTIDGVTVANNDRVLIKNESSGLKNGIYVVTDKGSGATPFILTRASDMDAASEVPGAFTFVEDGTTNTGSGYVVASSGPFTIGTTAITWTQFSGAGEITDGAALTKTGNTLDVAVDGSTIEVSSDALRVKDNGITLAKMATMATASLLGRNTASTGNVEVLSAATAKSLLSLNNVENTALSTWAGSANITTLGTIATGTWSATTIALNKGGTGQTTKAAAFDALSPMSASGDIIYGGTSGTGTRLAKGSDGQFLKLASGVPTWATGATPIDVQVFTASGTWTRPAGASWVEVIVIGGGGGGGGSQAKAAGTFRLGGSGGGGGSMVTRGMQASTLTSTVTVTVASAAAGGTAGGASGSNGTDGGTSSFGTYLVAYGGSGGTNQGANVSREAAGGPGAGTAAASATLAAGIGSGTNYAGGLPATTIGADGIGGQGGGSVGATAPGNGRSAEYGGGGGGANNNAAAAGAGGGSLWGGGGGGGGGGLNSSNTAFAAAAGGASGAYVAAGGGALGGAGTNGTDGTSRSGFGAGDGGGGGGASNAGAGGNGGNGGAPGGGGGGGGATGVSGGAGGNGGRGEVVVITYF